MESTKVILGSKKFPVRFSYAYVFEARPGQNGGAPKYGVAILIDKRDKDSIKKIEDAVALAAEQGKGKFKNGKIPANLKKPLRDGDIEREDDENYQGMYFINANSTRKPGIVDADLNELMDQDEFYSGCYGRATVNFFAFNTDGNQGIGAGLGNLQKLKDGDRLSGGASAADDFGNDDDDLS